MKLIYSGCQPLFFKKLSYQQFYQRTMPLKRDQPGFHKYPDGKPYLKHIELQPRSRYYNTIQRLEHLCF